MKIMVNDDSAGNGSHAQAAAQQDQDHDAADNDHRHQETAFEFADVAGIFTVIMSQEQDNGDFGEFRWLNTDRTGNQPAERTLDPPVNGKALIRPRGMKWIFERTWTPAR